MIRPPLLPVDEALRERASDEERADLIAKVRAALEFFEGERRTAGAALAEAEAEERAAAAELVPEERRWQAGLPPPDDDPLPLPPGHFRMPGGPWPRLLHLRARHETAERVRRHLVARVQHADKEVALRTSVLAQLERELAETQEERA